jgi:hypothetical protein
MLLLSFTVLVSASCVKNKWFSTCDLNNKRDLVVTASESCEGQYPVVYSNVDCDFECPAGYFLDVLEKGLTCSPCPAGSYSIGGGVIYGKEGNAWNEGSDSVIFSCSSRENTTYFMNYACNPWQVKDGMLVTNQSTKDMPYKAILTFFFDLVKPGNIIIRYKKETFEVGNKIIGEFSIMKNMQIVYIDSSSYKNHWKTVKIDLSSGFNEVVVEYKSEKVNEIWPKAAISTVAIRGMRFADEQCLTCSQGGSKEAAVACELCDFNEYWDQGGCIPCPFGTFSFRGARNVSSCLPREACNAADYVTVFSPCINGTITKIFDWKKPNFCDTSKFSLPGPISGLTCPSCHSGYFRNVSSSGVSSCVSCQEKHFFNETTGTCELCPDGQVPDKILNITEWNELPSLFQTSCIHSYGWVPSGEYISTGHLVHSNTELILSLNLDITSNTKARVSTYLEILNQNSGSLEILINSQSQSSLKSAEKQWKIIDLHPGPQLIQWIFRSSESLSEEVRIHSIIIEGSQLGVAISCSLCSPGFVTNNLECKACPAGSTSDDFHKTCQKCEKQFSSTSGSECFDCPGGTINDPEGRFCIAENVFYGNNNSYFIGNLTGRSPGFLCDLQTSQFYCLDTFYGPLAGDDKDFFISILNPGSLYLEFADFLHESVSGYAFAVIYDLEEEDSLKSSLKCVKNGKILNIGSVVSGVTDFGKGFLIEYSNGDACGDGQWKSSVNLTCDKEVAIGWPAFQMTEKCEVFFVWKSRLACPICDVKNVRIVKGSCSEGKRKVKAFEASHCVLSQGQREEWVEDCDEENSQIWVEISIGLAALALFIGVAVMSLMIFRYKQKYVKLKEVEVIPTKALQIMTD